MPYARPLGATRRRTSHLPHEKLEQVPGLIHRSEVIELRLFNNSLSSIEERLKNPPTEVCHERKKRVPGRAEPLAE